MADVYDLKRNKGDCKGLGYVKWKHETILRHNEKMIKKVNNLKRFIFKLDLGKNGDPRKREGEVISRHRNGVLVKVENYNLFIEYNSFINGDCEIVKEVKNG